ncbi:MAG: amidohydrolase family protein [Candidatus Baldrarchaeia archaeon]
MRVIDIHIHLAPPEVISPGLLAVLKRFGGLDPDFYTSITKNPEFFVKYMDENNIHAVCIMSYPAPDVMGWSDDFVDFVMNYSKNYPDRLLPFGSVHPRFSENPVPRLEELLSKYDMRGIKLHPVHQLFKPNDYRPEERGLKSLEKIYEFAVENDLPVLFHTGTSMFPRARNKYGDPIFLDDVAVDFPRMKIIMSHGGRPIWMQTAFFLLRRHKNIFLDISGIPPRRLLTYFPRFVEIADRALFGSDWPGPGVKSIDYNVKEFLSLPIPENIKKKVLFENAQKLLGIK